MNYQMTNTTFRRSLHVFHACMITTIGFLSASFLISYTSPIEDSILESGVLSIHTYPLFVSAINIGGLIGSISAGPISEWLGIKSSLILFSQFGVVGGLLLVWAHDGVSMTIGRVLAGVYTALCQSLVPVYNSEVSAYSYKKFYGGMLGVSIRCGLLSSYVLGVWIGYNWLAVTYLILIVFMNLNLVFLPESPKWLMKKGLERKAEIASEYFYNIPLSETVTKATYNNSTSQETTLRHKISNYLKWPILRPLFICCSLQILKTFSGHQYLLAYSAHTLDKAVRIDPKIASVFYPISLLLGATQFLWVIHRVEWKKLLLVTTLTQVFANGLLSLTFYLSIRELDCYHVTEVVDPLCDMLQAIPMIFISLMGFSFGLGCGSLAWWLYGQILHSYYTRISSSIATFSFITACILNQLIAPFVAQCFGVDSLFLCFAVICMFAFFVQLSY